MPEVATPPDSYRLDVSKMRCMDLFICVCVCPPTSRVLQQWGSSNCITAHIVRPATSAVSPNWSNSLSSSRWIVDYTIRSHSLGLATQYLFVTRHNRKIIVTDRKGWRWERGGGARCSLSYIDRCVVFCFKWRDWNFILRPRMLVPIPVGERERAFRGRKRDRYPLALFPLFLPLQYPCWDEGGADWRNGERREGWKRREEGGGGRGGGHQHSRNGLRRRSLASPTPEPQVPGVHSGSEVLLLRQSRLKCEVSRQQEFEE